MAKGNDGNYLQHSVEVAAALRLVQESAQETLHVALTHGMAPFEPCGTPPNGQSGRLLQQSLEAAQQPPIPGEAPLISAYRETRASRVRYPNTGELLAAAIGRVHLHGGITEVCIEKHVQLLDVWKHSGVTPINASWRTQVCVGGVLSCPANLRRPWLFAADPMTFCPDGCRDDDKLYKADLELLSAALQGFVASGQMGLAAIFVYSVRPDDRPQFWSFVDEAAARTRTAVVPGWVPHQGGNRNLTALLCFGISGCPLPDGVRPGR